MFSLSSSLRYYLYSHPTDMRKSFDSLCHLVSTVMMRNPLSGEVFIFINRPRNRMKLLRWDNGGFVLYYKRLESGTFELPSGVINTPEKGRKQKRSCPLGTSLTSSPGDCGD